MSIVWYYFKKHCKEACLAYFEPLLWLWRNYGPQGKR